MRNTDMMKILEANYYHHPNKTKNKPFSRMQVTRMAVDELTVHFLRKIIFFFVNQDL